MSVAVMIAETPKRSVRILEGAFKQADFARNTYRINIGNGVTLDDVLKHDYWANVARFFSADGGDLIEVLSDDKSFYAELIVLSASKVDAKVAVLRVVQLGALNREVIADDTVFAAGEQAVIAKRGKISADEFEVYWAGAGKWCVKRLSDKVKINDNGFASKEEAENFLSLYISRMQG